VHKRGLHKEGGLSPLSLQMTVDSGGATDEKQEKRLRKKKKTIEMTGGKGGEKGHLCTSSKKRKVVGESARQRESSQGNPVP